MLKDSFFVSLICTFGAYISRLYKNSFLSVIVEKIYGFFSRKWNESRIVGAFFSKAVPNKSFAEECVLRIKNIYLSVGGFMRRACSGSLIMKSIFGFMYGIIALNSRAVGMLLCGISIGNCVSIIALGGSVKLYSILILAFGVILSVYNVNISSFAENSKIIRALDSLFGFGFSYKLKVKEFFGGAYVISLLLGGISGVLLYKSVILAFIPIAGVFGACLLLKYPCIGAFAAVFVAPFVPTMLLVAIVLFSFACLVINSVYYGRLPKKLSTLSIIICLFIVVNAISAVTSFKMVNSLQVFAVTASMMLVYFVISGTVRDKKMLYAILRVFMVSGAIVAVYGILQYLFGWGLDVKNAWIDEEMFEDATVRVYSTLENPNVLGEYLLLTLFPCMIFMFKSDRWYSKALYGLFFAAMLICLVLTQSRGCWIGFIIGVAIYITFTHGRLWGFLPLALLFAPLVLPQSIIARFGSIGDLNDTSSSYRMFIWLGTIKMLKSFWLSGVGQGNQAFNAVYAYYSYSAINAPHAHNLYLQIFAESGIAAITVFLTICVSWFRRVASVFRNHRNSNTMLRLTAIAIGSAMAAYLVEGLFDYVFYNYRVMCLFWAALGMGAALYNTEEVSS